MELVVSKDFGVLPYVARITGLDRRYGFCREFVAPLQKDLSRSGATGTYVYHVEDGLYEVARSSYVAAGGRVWKRYDKLFLLVEGDDVRQLGRDQVVQSLKR